MTRTATWQPIKSGKYNDVAKQATIEIRADMLILESKHTVITAVLSDEVRLCRATEVEAAGVPSVIHDTLCGLLDEAAEDIGMNPNFYSEPDVELAKIEAVRNWLASLAKENHDASQT